MTEPGPLRERKKQRTRASIADAALHLFAEHGFANVTMADVAAAAEVGERTVFRYFPDKAELLFDDEEAVHDDLREALAARPVDEPPAVTVLEVLVAIAPRWQGRQRAGRARQAVIGASRALRERERAKQSDSEETLAAGLAGRGTDAALARLLARVAMACFDEATTHWVADDDPARPGHGARIRERFAQLADLLDEAGP